LGLLEEIGDVEGDVRVHGIAPGVRRRHPEAAIGLADVIADIADVDGEALVAETEASSVTAIISLMMMLSGVPIRAEHVNDRETRWVTSLKSGRRWWEPGPAAD
jgi:hypothetical protein